MIFRTLKSASSQIQDIIHKLIDHSKTSLSKAHRELLNSRLIIASTWLRVTNRLETAWSKEIEDPLWQSVMRFYRKDEHVFAQIDGTTIDHYYKY